MSQPEENNTLSSLDHATQFTDDLCPILSSWRNLARFAPLMSNLWRRTVTQTDRHTNSNDVRLTFVFVYHHKASQSVLELIWRKVLSFEFIVNKGLFVKEERKEQNTSSIRNSNSIDCTVGVELANAAAASGATTHTTCRNESCAARAACAANPTRTRTDLPLSRTLFRCFPPRHRTHCFLFF